MYMQLLAGTLCYMPVQPATGRFTQLRAGAPRYVPVHTATSDVDPDWFSPDPEQQNLIHPDPDPDPGQ